MKKINPPIHDDANELTILSTNGKLSSHPDLGNNLEVILEQYKAYLNDKGNPWSVSSISLPDNLKTALKLHYSSPPKDRLGFLDTYRRKLSPTICPMCGGPGTGTLDHYLPKEKYSEFSLFSKNLIPSCSCNTLRKSTVRGVASPERVIHPCYDDFLDERLYKAVFNGNFKTPRITVDVIDDTHTQIEILRFHLKEVILKNHILDWLDKTWGTLSLRPHALFNMFLPEGEVDITELKVCIEKYVKVKDAEYETPNNWWSIFYVGLLSDDNRLRELSEKINNLRT